MIKQVLILIFVFMFAYEANAMAITQSELDSELVKDLPKKMLLEELEEYKSLLDKKLLDMVIKRRITKRSDIDARLLELQAKILLSKAYANGPVGHGKFDFDLIGKRSSPPYNYDDISISSQQGASNDYDMNSLELAKLN